MRNSIREKDFVIVQKGNYLKACRIARNRPQKFGKNGESQMTISLENGIGHQYGTIFKLIRGNKVFHLELHDDVSEGIDLDVESGIDNRNILDDGQSQSLSKSDIKQLVDSGISGDEVIQTLTQNSKTFKSKTKYSQEKYVSKKLKKYDELVTLHQPSIRLLMHMYYSQDPLKISNLRIDSISQMMAYVNIQPGGSYAVYEAGMQGLLTASMLSLIGSEGSLVHIYSGYNPHKDAVEMMSFSTEELLTLSFLGSNNLPIISEDPNSNVEANGFESSQTEKKQDLGLKEETSEDGKLENADSVSEIANNNNNRKFVRRRSEDIEVSTKVLLNGVHGLIVACRQHSSAITLALLPYLIPGHSFAIYSPYKEVLMDLFIELKAENCVNIRLVENWLRNYQVLPERTHPEVNMSGGGGYILTGWKVWK